MLMGEGYNEMVDIWALGCCLFELLAGQTPFAASDANAVREVKEKGGEKEGLY